MLPGRLQSFWTLAQTCPQSDARSVQSPLPADGAVAASPASQAIAIGNDIIQTSTILEA